MTYISIIIFAFACYKAWRNAVKADRLEYSGKLTEIDECRVNIGIWMLGGAFVSALVLVLGIWMDS